MHTFARWGAQEEEFENFHAPEDLLKEEEALHKEREAREAAELAALKEAGAGAGPALETKRFQALEQLLHQSACYSQFLAEQMLNIEEQTEQDAKRAAGAGAGTSTASGAATGKGGKRTTRGDAGRAVKKTKSTLSATQVRRTGLLR